MTVTVRYIGTVDPYFETAVTGKPGKWRPGGSGDVSDVDAALLIATGVFEVYADRVLPFAFNSSGGIAGVRMPDNSVLPVGSGSSSGIATSSGSDMTYAEVVGGVITEYTAGAKWVITRDGSLVPQTQHLFGDAALASTLTHVGNGIYVVSGGLKFVSGSLCMTVAQRNTWVSLSPEIANGFMIFLTDAGLLTKADGSTAVPGAHQRWVDGFGFIYTTPVRYEFWNDSITINAASGAWATLRSQVVPATVPGPYSRVRMFANTEWATAAGTRALRLQINGASIFEQSGVAAAANVWQQGKSLFGRGTGAQRRNGLTQGDNNGQTASWTATTIDFSTTALTCTLQATALSTDTVTDRAFHIHITDELNSF